MGPGNQPPTAAEFGQLRARLAIRGMTQAQINAAIGTAPNGRPRDAIVKQLTDWLRARPKG